MGKKDKCSVIYSVDDDHYTVHIWYQFEADKTFLNVSYDGSDTLDDALKHAHTCKEPTLYVLDSKMSVSAAIFAEMQKTIQKGLHIDIEEFQRTNVLTGVFGGAYVKLIRSDSKVILLTAFHKEVSKQTTDRRIKRILDFACDQILPKPCRESDVISAISKYVDAANLLTGGHSNGFRTGSSGSESDSSG